MGQKQASRQKGLKRSDERSHDEYAVLKEQLRERDSTIARLETDLANSIDVILGLRKSPDCPDNATLRNELESLLYQITRWATITFVKSKIDIKFKRVHRIESSDLPDLLKQNMPGYCTSQDAQYKRDILAYLVASTITEHHVRFGPFGPADMDGKDAEWSSFSGAAYTLEQVTSDHAYKDWLLKTQSVLIQADMWSDFTCKLEESLRDSLYTSINRFTNIKTNADIERGLNRITAAAIALSLRLHFHPATFRFTPYYFDMKEKDESKIYSGVIHEAYHQGPASDGSRIAAIVYPGLARIRDEMGEEMPEEIISKVQVLLDEHQKK